MSPKTTPSASRVSAAREERLPRESCSGISWEGAQTYYRTAQNANLAAGTPGQIQVVVQPERKSLLFLGTWLRLEGGCRLMRGHRQNADRNHHRRHSGNHQW